MLSSEPSQALVATIIKGAEHSPGAATAPNPYSPSNRHQGAEGPLHGSGVLGCYPQPLQQLSNQIIPWWICPIFCLRQPPPAPLPDSLSVCTAINKYPEQAVATLALCEGPRSKHGLISNKYWFVCKWNSGIYGMMLDTQVVTKLPWGQMLSRMLISHLYEGQQSRNSKDFCRTLPFGSLWRGSKTGLCNL